MIRLALLCAGLTVSAASPAAPLRVFIVAGQSNILNWHAAASALPADPADASILCWHLSGAPPGRGLAFSANASSGGRWVPLGPQRQDPYHRHERDFFGPEMTLARNLRRHGTAPVAVIKVGFFGTSLARDWDPALPGGDRLHATLVREVTAALHALTASGRAHELAGFFWLQGETDAAQEAPARAYAANLAHFIAATRRELGVPGLPVILGRIGPPPPNGYPYQELVRQAQVEIARQLPHVALVSTDDLPRGSDGIHLTAAGVMTLGERWAEAWREHQRYPAESTVDGSPSGPPRP